MNKLLPSKIVKAMYTDDYKTLTKYLNSDTVNLVDKDGDTLLSLATTASEPNIEMIGYLLSVGADINVRLGAQRWTLLHYAVHLMNYPLARVLIEAGADVNATDAADISVLECAALAPTPNPDVVQLLLHHGADKNRKIDGAKSALELASETGQTSLLGG